MQRRAFVRAICVLHLCRELLSSALSSCNHLPSVHHLLGLLACIRYPRSATSVANCHHVVATHRCFNTRNVPIRRGFHAQRTAQPRRRNNLGRVLSTRHLSNRAWVRFLLVKFRAGGREIYRGRSRGSVCSNHVQLARLLVHWLASVSASAFGCLGCEGYPSCACCLTLQSRGRAPASRVTPLISNVRRLNERP